jgi:hypothetical protein
VRKHAQPSVLEKNRPEVYNYDDMTIQEGGLRPELAAGGLPLYIIAFGSFGRRSLQLLNSLSNVACGWKVLRFEYVVQSCACAVHAVHGRLASSQLPNFRCVQ